MVTSERKKQIEMSAMDLLSQSYEKSEIIPPINLDKIIKKSGLLLKFGEFKDQNIDGAYNSAEKTIFLRDNTPYVRQAFTVAHELGHYYLHKDKTTEVFYRKMLFDDNNGDEQEQEANLFAASLLMPRNLVESFWSMRIFDVSTFAKIFGVSSSAAYWRLKNMRLI